MHLSLAPPPRPFHVAISYRKIGGQLSLEMGFTARYQCQEFQLQRGGAYKYKEETFHSASSRHIWLGRPRGTLLQLSFGTFGAAAARPPGNKQEANQK